MSLPFEFVFLNAVVQVPFLLVVNQFLELGLLLRRTAFFILGTTHQPNTKYESDHDVSSLIIAATRRRITTQTYWDWVAFHFFSRVNCVVLVWRAVFVLFFLAQQSSRFNLLSALL